MRLTFDQLNRALLDRQGLLERTRCSVVDMTRRVLALQAQEPASPYVALWNRIDAFSPDELDAAFADRTITKSSLMRVTLHAVAADDHAWMRAAMLPILHRARLNDARFTKTGLTIEEAASLADAVVAFADRPRSKDELLVELGRLDARAPAAWWALRTVSGLIHSPVGAPWSFPYQPHYEAVDATGEGSHHEAMSQLVRRHVAAFGPARPQDIARFSLHKVSTINDVIASMSDEVLHHDGPDGHLRVDLAEARPIPDEATPAPPRLLGMWDSVLFAHADRTVVISDDHRSHVIRRNGDTLATVLVDGRVAGVWRAVDGGVEITPFGSWSNEVWRALADEAVALGRLLIDREPLVYRRYQRWWERLPDAGRRVLPY